MNILVIGLDYEEGFARYIANAAKAMGHSVVLFDPILRRTKIKSEDRIYQMVNRRLYTIFQTSAAYSRLLEHKLFSAINDYKSISLVIVCSDFLTPKTVARIKKRISAPIVLWFPDAVSSFRRHMFLNASYDALFFKDPYIVQNVQSMTNLPIYYLPEAFDPESVYPVELSDEDRQKYECDITIAGNMYAYRLAVLNNLSDFKLKLWGHPPPHWAIVDNLAKMPDQFVSGVNKAKAFRAARIALNSMHPAEVWGLNVRTFEIAGARAFQMIDWRPGLSQLFVDGKELITFSGIHDLREKAIAYLADTDKRAEIAAAGYDRAVAEHTYQHRLQIMFDTVMKGEKGYPMPVLNWRLVLT